MRTSRQETLAGFIIKIEQQENTRGLFRVSYGAQVRDNLTYIEAAKEYELCVLHALACEGKLDNDGE